MMLLNDKRTLIQPQDVFDETGSLTEEGRETIQTKCKDMFHICDVKTQLPFPCDCIPVV